MSSSTFGDALTVAPAPKIRVKRSQILCIDDDPDITRAIELILSNYDVEVVRDFCGQQGIWDAVKKKPDLIITDLRMANGGGEDLLQCVKGNVQTSHIPVIVLTGQRGSHLAGRVRKLGASGFLQKPVHYETLLATIREFIDLPELNWACVDERGVRSK